MSAHAAEGEFETCDLMTLSGVLRVSDLEMVLLLGSNAPRARCASSVQGEAMFFSGEAEFPFRGRFALPQDWCLMGYLHHAPEGGWCHGNPLGSGVAFTVMPEGISEFMLAARSQVSFVLAPVEWLRQLEVHRPLGVETKSSQLFFVGEGADGQRLASGFSQLQQQLLARPEPSAEPVLDEAWARQLVEMHWLAARSARAEDLPRYSRGRRTHYLILQRTEHFMRANLRRDIYINEMCNAAGVSERALRYAFDDLLGTSPNRYLSLLRLCTACRSLSLADASRRSVKSVALSCGLWDLSRFADNYRRVFGELPRDTLMRSPPRESSTPGSS